jgi:hypothetical protein
MAGLMKFSKRQAIRLIVMLAFLACMLFANFYAVRKMLDYGVKVYFYDKLLVAYNIGGIKGLEDELEKIRVTDKMPRELILAEEFASRLKSLKEPAVFLEDKVEWGKKRINFIRSLRSGAIVLMVLIFGYQLILEKQKREEKRIGNSGGTCCK